MKLFKVYLRIRKRKCMVFMLRRMFIDEKICRDKKAANSRLQLSIKNFLENPYKNVGHTYFRPPLKPKR